MNIENRLAVCTVGNMHTKPFTPLQHQSMGLLLKRVRSLLVKADSDIHDSYPMKKHAHLESAIKAIDRMRCQLDSDAFAENKHLATSEWYYGSERMSMGKAPMLDPLHPL
jgi:hypothetical protein